VTMAVMTTIHCTVCKETKRECRSNNDYSSVCGECSAAAADKKRREHLASRKGLTVEERLELLEQWQYDYRPPRSIHDVRF
jgi:hypothetical protein